MTDDRTPRANEARDEERSLRSDEVAMASWSGFRPPQLIPDVPVEPGWAFRWVRVSSRGEADDLNVSVRFREGWVPCARKDYPKQARECGLPLEGNGNITMGGLMMCKMPEEQARAREQYYSQMSQQQQFAVDQSYMRLNNPKMPLLMERKTTTSYGRGPE